MFLDDIYLVREQVAKYSNPLRRPLVDLGGLPKPTIADYNITMRTGRQRDRYIKLPNNARPFDSLDPHYQIFNPELGSPSIEQMVGNYDEQIGTLLCLNVIEHVENPFSIFEAFRELLKPNGVAIVSTVFSFPYHPSPRDYWRFSPDCLRMLAGHAGLEVLETNWRLTILADAGIKEIHTGVPQEVKSVYVTMRKA